MAVLAFGEVGFYDLYFESATDMPLSHDSISQTVELYKNKQSQKKDIEVGFYHCMK